MPQGSERQLSLQLTTEEREVMIAEGRAATGRSCGGFSMCCKLPPFEIDGEWKPENVWCKYCRPGGAGCLIYDRRPEYCRGYSCLWLVHPDVRDHWKPSQSKMVMTVQEQWPGIWAFVVNVDPSAPNVWRDPRFYPDLKSLARHALAGRAYVGIKAPCVVVVRKQQWVILPDKDVEVTSRSFHFERSRSGEWDIVFAKGEGDSHGSATGPRTAALNPRERGAH
jgi:hypothetical protein